MRSFVSFKRLRDPGRLRNVKLRCVEIEKKFSRGGKRKINIDPGYISEANLVLSTTKDFSHRIYLGKGVFAEITLLYSGKHYIDLPWTYPDYKTNEYKAIFSKIRGLYREQLIT